MPDHWQLPAAHLASFQALPAVEVDRVLGHAAGLPDALLGIVHLCSQAEVRCKARQNVAYLADADAPFAGVEQGAEARSKAMQQGSQVLSGASALLLGSIWPYTKPSHAGCMNSV